MLTRKPRYFISYNVGDQSVMVTFASRLSMCWFLISLPVDAQSVQHGTIHHVR